MKAIKATDDLTIEVWPDWGAGGDTPLVKVHSLALERDGEASPGVIIVFEGEIEHLVAALAEARAVLEKTQDVVTVGPAAGHQIVKPVSPPEEEQER